MGEKDLNTRKKGGKNSVWKRVGWAAKGEER